MLKFLMTEIQGLMNDKNSENSSSQIKLFFFYDRGSNPVMICYLTVMEILMNICLTADTYYYK